MSDLPEILAASIGGAMGNSYDVKLIGARLQYETFGNFYDPENQTIVMPDDAAWARFRSDLDQIPVWVWATQYHTDPPVMDGTSWHIHVKYRDRELESSGTNAYPGRHGRTVDSPSKNSDFERFLKAISRLLGGLMFR